MHESVCLQIIFSKIEKLFSFTKTKTLRFINIKNPGGDKFIYCKLRLSSLFLFS